MPLSSRPLNSQKEKGRSKAKPYNEMQKQSLSKTLIIIQDKFEFKLRLVWINHIKLNESISIFQTG